MAKLFANSGNPDQTPRSAASDQGLHCFPLLFYGPPNYNGLMFVHIILLQEFERQYCTDLLFSQSYIKLINIDIIYSI